MKINQLKANLILLGFKPDNSNSYSFGEDFKKEGITIRVYTHNASVYKNGEYTHAKVLSPSNALRLVNKFIHNG